MQLLELELCASLLLDDAGVVTRVGAGFESILGWAGDDVVGRRWQDLCKPGHRDRFVLAMGNLRRGAPSASVRADFPLRLEEKRLVTRMAREEGGFVLVVEDVGEKAAVVQGSSKLQHLVDFAADSWFVHDLEGRIRDVNPWVCKNLQYTREEILGMRVAEFETTIQPGRMDGVWNRMEIGVPVSVEGRQRRKDGSTFPVDVRLGLFESGDEVLMLAVARDITKLKRVESTLQQLNAELENIVAERTEQIELALSERQAMLDSLADGIVATDAGGLVRLANPAMSELLGADVQLGVPVEQTLPDSITAVVDRAVTTLETAHGEARLPEGRVVQVQASPILVQAVLGGVVARVQDVTLEREVDRMKTDFIATVSHELRTPLTSVLGFAKITRNQLDSKLLPHLDLDNASVKRAAERVRKNIDIITSEGERLTALINDVLDISKMESGRMEWAFEPIDVAELVSTAGEATAGLFLDLPLRIAVEPDLPAVSGDRDRLLQVLINLLSNAAKFSEDLEVVLSAALVSGGVELAVRDSGMGIAPGLHAAVFDKFKQVGDTLTDKPKGTGLGLPICQQIAHAHGTEITVQSELGEGARFAFVLDATVEVPSDRTAELETLMGKIERRVPRSDSPRLRTILVVDDDPHIRELLRQQLTDRGYQVRQATNGFEAIGQIRTTRPDLVILDVMMPELSGFDVAAMIKSDPSTESIPVLILSIIEDTERGLRLGVDRYLTKPAEAEDLLLAVRELLGQVSSPRRVLVVDENASTSSDIGRLLEVRGYQVVATVSGQECLEKARETRPDLIIFESTGGEQEELLRTIRFERGLENVYIVQLLEGEPA